MNFEDRSKFKSELNKLRFPPDASATAVSLRDTSFGLPGEIPSHDQMMAGLYNEDRILGIDAYEKLGLTIHGPIPEITPDITNQCAHAVTRSVIMLDCGYPLPFLAQVPSAAGKDACHFELDSKALEQLDSPLSTTSPRWVVVPMEIGSIIGQSLHNSIQEYKTQFNTEVTAPDPRLLGTAALLYHTITGKMLFQNKYTFTNTGHLIFGSDDNKNILIIDFPRERHSALGLAAIGTMSSQDAINSRNFIYDFRNL